MVRCTVVSLAVALASCQRTPAPAPSAEPIAPQPAAAPSDAGSSEPGTPEIAAADRPIVERAVAAMEAGDHEFARKVLVGLLDRYPQNTELARLHDEAVAGKARDEQRRAALRPTKLDPVPLRRHKVRDAPITQGRKPTLVLASKTRNGIVDVEAWFRDNALSMPTWEVPTPRRNPQGNVPSWIPREVEGKRIVQAIDDGDHAIAMYAETYWRGRVVLVFDKGREVIAAFDISAWSRPRRSPDDDAADRRVTWALVRDGVLFISSGHFSYAKASGGRTGFLTAFDLATGELLWRSDPLVANANNFLYQEGYIISGYGFTAEPDFLFVVDAKTGKTVTKTKLRKGPDFILEKSQQVFVRTYDTDYVFDLR